MKHFIIVAGCTLALLHSVQGELNSEKWRDNARDFGNETAMMIKEIYHGGNRLCSDLKQHIVHAEVDRIIHRFFICDDNDRKHGSEFDRESCYFHQEKYFHDKVNRMKEDGTCNKTNVCSFFNEELDELIRAPSCFYFASLDVLIELWSKCYFMDPVVGIIDSLEQRMFCIGEDCSRDHKILDDSLKQAVLDNDHCKKKIVQNLKEQRYLILDNELDCTGLIGYSNARRILKDCYIRPLTAIEKLRREMNGKNKIFTKLPSQTSSLD